MTSSVVVVDTNVLISGLLTTDGSAPTASILDAMLKGEIRAVLSMELLAEYREVLLRSAIRSRHGLEESEIDTILTAIAENAIVCEPAEPPTPPPDPGDLHLWSILAARSDAVLITGDHALVVGSPEWATVVSPREFVRGR